MARCPHAEIVDHVGVGSVVHMLVEVVHVGGEVDHVSAFWTTCGPRCGARRGPQKAVQKQRVRPMWTTWTTSFSNKEGIPRNGVKMGKYHPEVVCIRSFPNNVVQVVHVVHTQPKVSKRSFSAVVPKAAFVL